MNSIRLKTSPAREKLPAGKSKLLGNPDVWEHFVWPFAVDADGCESDPTHLLLGVSSLDNGAYDAAGGKTMLLQIDSFESSDGTASILPMRAFYVFILTQTSSQRAIFLMFA